MPDQFEHYITKNIKAFYKRRLLTPILYLIFLLVLWFVLSLSAPLFPDTLDASDSLITICSETRCSTSYFLRPAAMP